MSNEHTTSMGAFSISLTVKDIKESKKFYADLGFRVAGGDEAQNWLILRNGYATIGLFQGMFDQNIMTFNPGWDGQANNLDEFTDVRELQQGLKSKGIELAVEANESSVGPASFMITDPDGNQILIDQHV